MICFVTCKLLLLLTPSPSVISFFQMGFFLGKVMKTKFGKFLKKLRIDHDERLSDMARKLKVSSSFLSNVENGKKMFPGRFCAELCILYNLEEKQKLNLMDAVMGSIEEYRKTVKLKQVNENT